MHDTQFNDFKVFSILTLTMNKKVVEAEISFLALESYLYNGLCFNNYNT